MSHILGDLFETLMLTLAIFFAVGVLAFSRWLRRDIKEDYDDTE